MRSEANPCVKIRKCSKGNMYIFLHSIFHYGIPIYHGHFQLPSVIDDKPPYVYELGVVQTVQCPAPPYQPGLIDHLLGSYTSLACQAHVGTSSTRLIGARPRPLMARP
eukprot:1371937-Amorphochlora_amoeboformis.AAC.1